MGIEKYEIEPAAIKENGVASLRLTDIKLPKYFKIKGTFLIFIPPGAYGGNHKHPRREAFIGNEDLLLLWNDSKGEIHEEKFYEKGKFYLILIQPLTPHVVINTSKTHSSLLYEIADDLQHDVEVVNLV